MIKYKSIKLKSIRINDKFQKVIIGIITFIILFAICIVCIIPKKYDLKQGDISPADIKAPRDFIDEIATQSKIDKAVLNVQPQYNKNTDIMKDSISKVSEYFSKVEEIKSSTKDEKERIEKLKLKTSNIIKLSQDDYSLSLSINNDEMKNLIDFMDTMLTKIYSGDIKEGNEEDLKKTQEDLNFYIRNSNLSKSLKELATNMGIGLIRPNVFYDSDRTESLKNMVKKQVETVIIKKSQNIVLKGEVITDKHIYEMKQTGLLHQNAKMDIIIYIGLGLLILIAESLIAYFLYKYRKKIYTNNSKLIIIASIICINTGLTAALKTISVYLIPSALVVILMCLIFDSLTAFAVSTISTILIACVTNFNIDTTLLYLVSSFIGIMLSYNINQRSNIIVEGFLISIINGIFVFSLGLINNITVVQNAFNSLNAVAGGITSAILAIGILPIYEQIFNVITPIKLLELANPNQPLLKKLLFEAPGTYHHSILVGNLAESAADEIGANSLLTRTGAYYHDIGKIKRPYFFKENQITNDNPHDKITPKLSTLIITSHVKDGIELAMKYRLPKAVIDIITEHHGTTLVKYFYVMALNDGKQNVEEKMYRYDGPKPSTKESALIMLADSIEAAVRSLSNPSIDDVKNMIDKIIKDKINDGQLDECSLTFGEIDKVKKCFIKALMGITHSRIEYPEINEENL